MINSLAKLIPPPQYCSAVFHKQLVFARFESRSCNLRRFSYRHILFSSFEFGNLQNTCNENRPCEKESCHRMRQLNTYVENTAVHIVMVGGSSSTENRDLDVCFPFFLINTRFL